MKVAEFLRSRIAASGYDYPLAVPLSCLTVTSVIAVVAVAQRDAIAPPGWALLWGAVVVAPYAWELVSGAKTPRSSAVLALIMIAGTSLLLLDPVEADVAPLILAMMAGGTAATAPIAVSISTTAGGLVALGTVAAAGGLTEPTVVPLYFIFVALGWMVGFMLRSQLRLMHKEQEAQASKAAQAATDERQRIAREVHDVIAHSLSVTLLHLTGARRALQQDSDVDEAIAGLTDAERLGRQAMADIRRTVGLLDSTPSNTAPEPGIGDLPDLIEDFRNAGLSVGYEQRGDPEAVSGATGLGLYRIAQESLANVVKHAPGASAEVELHVTDGEIELSIRNDRLDRAAGTASDPVRGNGVSGMRQRAELLGGRLHAGPDPRGWSVRAAVPVDVDSATPPPRCRRISGSA